MTRDFDQLVGDARYWLRNNTKPRLSRKNHANSFGVLRQDFRILEGPEQCVTGFELTSVFGGRCIAGAIQVESLTGNGVGELTELAWDDQNMAVRSLMTGSAAIHLLHDLPGVVLDNVHNQIAVPLQRILQNTNA